MVTTWNRQAIRTVAVFAVAACAATAGTVVATAAAAAPAPADSPTTLSGIKLKATDEINRRVHDLDAAAARASAAKGLGANQASLVTYLGADVEPLTQLNQKIQGDSSVAQARQDFSDIFSGYRVYLLVLPAARIAGDADHAVATAIPALMDAATKAQQHVTPSNQAALQPLIDDLQAQITTASSASNGLAATVLAFTPAQWNADHNLLSAARASDQQADAALQKGRADVRSIRQQLRGPG